ncbi:unnamed protein product [Caenorhabditis angaria]|uniref:RecQ-mediated genome instability protein 1 n=1 Tax=Caenorhabditis angaria TaxID=860376 RepID=A0A9P1MUN7_9PELO|nr:unnamed protein product [Caenorhabditis angaria]
MIKVELSDGINHIHAIEICEPIFDLESIVPGMKIILIDKVRCRRGILLLDSSNCQILGGQVEQHNYLPVEKMAKMLKIDLDAETKRKTLANEKAAEIRKTRKVKQVLTQSTISPFLVKKNRKEPETDDFDLVGVTPMEVSNITLAAEKEEGDDVIFTPLPVEKLPTNTMQRKEPESIKNNNFDDVIFTPLPVEKLPTKTMQRKEPESIKNNNSDVIFTPLPVQKLPTKNLQRKEPESIKNNFDDVIFTPLQVEKNPQKDSRPQNDLNFNVFSKPPRIQEEPIPKRPPMTTNVSIAEINEKKTDFSKLDFRKSEDFNVFPNRKPKMLTRQLLEDSEPRLKPPQKEPEIEIYEPGKLRNLLPNDRISWQPESVKNEFEDYESRILPPGFEKASTLNRTKNGGGGGEFEDTRRKIVDKFSRNIHGPRNAATKRVLNSTNSVFFPDLKKDNSKIVTEFFKSVKHLKQSEEEFNNKSRKIEIVAPTQITLQNQDDQIIEDEEEEEEIQEEPIIDRRNLGNPMNNTIELDGMKECRRWKIGGYESPAQNIETNDILPTWNPDVLTYKFTEYQPSSSNQPVKIEPSFTAPKKNKKNNLVHKPIARLSENVQIYRTPLVKRVPSAENSAIYTEELCKRLANLNIVPLRDALETRKYWMMSKIVVIMVRIFLTY